MPFGDVQVCISAVVVSPVVVVMPSMTVLIIVIVIVIRRPRRIVALGAPHAGGLLGAGR
jgi:hypothetical protein